jgi:SnoaL-like domain
VADSLLQHVADELDVMRLLARLAQAADDADVEAYQQCFAEKVLCAPEDPSGTAPLQLIPSNVYARSAIESTAAMDWIHHSLSNFIITLDGDLARVQADVVAQMQATDVDGKLEYFTMGGRYELELARLASGWRITMRRRKVRYTIGDPGLVDRAKQRRAAAAAKP